MPLDGVSVCYRRRVVAGGLLGILLPLLTAVPSDARADGDTRLGPASIFAGAPGTAQTTEPIPHLSLAIGLSPGYSQRAPLPGPAAIERNGELQVQLSFGLLDLFEIGVSGAGQLRFSGASMGEDAGVGRSMRAGLMPIWAYAKLAIPGLGRPRHGTGWGVAVEAAVRIPLASEADPRLAVWPRLITDFRARWGLLLALDIAVPFRVADDTRPTRLALDLNLGISQLLIRRIDLHLFVSGRVRVPLGNSYGEPDALPATLTGGLTFGSPDEAYIQLGAALDLPPVDGPWTRLWWSAFIRIGWLVGRGRAAAQPEPPEGQPLPSDCTDPDATAMRPRETRRLLASPPPPERPEDACLAQEQALFAEMDRALRAQLAAISHTLDQIPSTGGGLQRGVGDFSAYIGAVRNDKLPLIETMLADASTLAQRARSASPTVRQPYAHGATVRLHAAAILAGLLRMESDLAVVAAYVNAEGVPFGVVKQSLEAFDRELEPLAQAALSLDIERTKPALAALQPACERAATQLDAALEKVGKNALAARRTTMLANTLLLAVSLYQVYRAPVIPESPSRPAIGGISAGGAAVSATTLADIRVLQALVAGVQKLVAMPAAVPAFAGAGGIAAQVGSPTVDKPQIDMHQRAPTPAQVARGKGASGTNSLGGRAPPGFRSTQTWNTSKNAKILRKNVEAERRRNGQPPIRSDEEVHHIEPSTSQFGEKGRQVLDQQAIDINTAENGVVLKRGEHRARGLHTKKAIDEVNDRLRRAANTGGREEVFRELRRIRDQILRGSFPRK